MNSILTSSRILPSLKRRSRTAKSNPEIASPRAKPLDILPELSEEDEGRPSLCSLSSIDSTLHSYHASRSFSGSATVGDRRSLAERKRDSRRVVLTGAEGLSFEDFFPVSSSLQRPPPASPLFETSTPLRESPLDDIKLRFSSLGISFDFPSPPPDRTSSGSRPVTLSRHRDHSPTPSVSSVVTSITSSSSSSSRSTTTDITPPTSEDECCSNIKRVPSCKSRRASIHFLKSMPDVGIPDLGAPSADDVDEGVDEDAEWFARDISDVFTLSSPHLPSPLDSTSPSADLKARPDSISIAPRAGCSRHSKPLPIPPVSSRPSLQLDPMFPQKRRNSFLIPDRSPPPPPIIVSPISMEEETEEMLAQLANAALNSGFLGTNLVPPREGFLTPISTPSTPSSRYICPTPRLRPPPRTSLPADIHDFCDEALWTLGAGEVEVEVGPEIEADTVQGWPSTPQSISVYSQASMSVDALPITPLSSFEFDVELVPDEEGKLAHMCTREDAQPERTLRSRWSSSTLGSMAEASSSAPFWMPKFNLSPTKKSAGKRFMPQKTPVSPAKRSFESELDRRDSRSSRMSCDSGDSSSNSGLKRKPIPVQIFMR